jgi:hypothetical protein
MSVQDERIVNGILGAAKLVIKNSKYVRSYHMFQVIGYGLLAAPQYLGITFQSIGLATFKVLE